MTSGAAVAIEGRAETYASFDLSGDGGYLIESVSSSPIKIDFLGI
jgi:hypothetical protein